MESWKEVLQTTRISNWYSYRYSILVQYSTQNRKSQESRVKRVAKQWPRVWARRRRTAAAQCPRAGCRCSWTWCGTGACGDLQYVQGTRRAKCKDCGCENVHTVIRSRVRAQSSRVGGTEPSVWRLKCISLPSESSQNCGTTSTFILLAYTSSVWRSASPEVRWCQSPSDQLTEVLMQMRQRQYPCRCGRARPAPVSDRSSTLGCATAPRRTCGAACRSRAACSGSRSHYFVIN